MKILLIVLPLLTVAIVMVGGASYLLAASSVNQLTVEFFDFMAEEIRDYAEGQWNLLIENDAVGNPLMEDAAKLAVQNFSRALLRSDTQTIFALDTEGNLAMNVGPVLPSPEEQAILRSLVNGNSREFLTVKIENKTRVAYTIMFPPFSWYIFVTEERSQFYGAVEQIFRTSLYILLGALIVGVLLMVSMAMYLTKPIEIVVTTMRHIIDSNSLTEEVPVYYKDEIGQLSATFNYMLKTLAEAYEQIKHYAFDTAVARKREMKIRNIFQLYVPNDVIEGVFVNPERMLVGNNQEIAILFSDIRSFTTISERMAPDDLVNSLNRYFSIMVNVIMDRNGVVDKYIGDAIMAIFGVPLAHANDALASVLAGLEMMNALHHFNKIQTELGAPEFHIGVGINYGIVTVGNIGCDKKMNYTVIGDAVNLASRLEGLTKKYKEAVLFSESVYEKLPRELPCRVLDRVAVKGKSQGVPILTARLKLNKAETEVWKYHAEGVKLYYDRNFQKALMVFEKILTILPKDPAALRFEERCRIYSKNPPPPEWDGVEIMTEK